MCQCQISKWLQSNVLRLRWHTKGFLDVVGSIKLVRTLLMQLFHLGAKWNIYGRCVFTFDVRASGFMSGRSNDWLNKTCVQRKTLTIAAYALDGKLAAISEVCSTGR